MTSIVQPARLHGSGTVEIFIAIGLSVGAAVSLGFSRFAYSLLLPPMRASLHWTYVQAGGMNTANAIGYLVGSAATAWLSKRLGIKRTFLFSLALSGLMLLASGLVATYTQLATLRAIGGFSTAVLFVIGASLATTIDPDHGPGRRALLMAVYITGVGSGIVVSGLVVPPILAWMGNAGWQTGWIAMGVISLLALIPAAASSRVIPPQTSRDASVLPWRDAIFLAPAILSYGLYGAGYVSYMTFIIVLLQHNGGSAHTTTAFWILLGLSSAIGTLIWGRVIPKLSDAKGVPVICLMLLIGTMPVLISPTLTAAFVSAIIFGATFMAGPTAVAVRARKLVQPQHYTVAIAVLTISFAIGQSAGPVISGYISDVTGSVNAGLWIAPAILILAAVASPFQRNR